MLSLWGFAGLRCWDASCSSNNQISPRCKDREIHKTSRYFPTRHIPTLQRQGSQRSLSTDFLLRKPRHNLPLTRRQSRTTPQLDRRVRSTVVRFPELTLVDRVSLHATRQFMSSTRLCRHALGLLRFPLSDGEEAGDC